MQVALQDAIRNDHENSGEDSVWNTNTAVAHAVKKGTCLMGGGEGHKSTWITRYY